MDVEVAATLEEAHVGDASALFFGTILTCSGGAIIQIRHRVAVAVDTRLVDDVFEFMLNRFASFLFA